MDTTFVMTASTIGMVIVLVGSVYAGLYFSKKSAQRRREIEEKRRELHEAESKNRRKF